MKTAIILLMAIQAPQDAQLRDRLNQQLAVELAKTRKAIQELVLKELSAAGIGENSLGAQVDRFAKSLVNDDLHNRLKKLLLSKDGKDLVESFMAEQNLENLDEVLETYFEKDKNGKYRVREEFEEVLAQMLDVGTPSPAAGSIGVDLILDKAAPDKVGLPVAGVTAGGPAAAAGLKSGDLLISVNGRDLTTSNVQEVMKTLTSGADVKVIYERDKARTTVTVKAK